MLLDSEVARFAALFTLIMAATSAMAQDNRNDDQVALAATICEKEFMVSCTPGGDPQKERCFTVPACYKIERCLDEAVIEALERQGELDARSRTGTASSSRTPRKI
jgi:hypothetical protein